MKILLLYHLPTIIILRTCLEVKNLGCRAKLTSKNGESCIEFMIQLLVIKEKATNDIFWFFFRPICGDLG